MNVWVVEFAEFHDIDYYITSGVFSTKALADQRVNELILNGILTHLINVEVFVLNE